MRIDTMSRDLAESYCAIQFKLDALLRNPIAQKKILSDKTEKQPCTRVDLKQETGIYTIASDP